MDNNTGADGDISRHESEPTDESYADAGRETMTENPPLRFTKDQVYALRAIHGAFARSLSTSLCEFLRMPVTVRLARADQLSFCDFIRAISGPTLLNIIGLQPLEGRAILEISPAVTFPALDRLTGGGGFVTEQNREITDLEYDLAVLFCVRILDDYCPAWSQFGCVIPELENVHASPYEVRGMWSDSANVILFTFEITLGEKAGNLSICIPYSTLLPVAVDLTKWAQQCDSSRPGSTTHDIRYDCLSRLMDRPLPVYTEEGAYETSFRNIVWPGESEMAGPPRTATGQRVVCIGWNYHTQAENASHK